MPAISKTANYHTRNQDNVGAATGNGRTAFYLLDGHGDTAERLTHSVLPSILARELTEPSLNPSSVMRLVDDMLTTWVYGGTTFTGVVVDEDKITTINLGDSRTVVVSASGKVMHVTEEHQPTSKREAERIAQAGGRVEMGRINGMIAVSRALGDYVYKATTPPLMSNAADVAELTLEQPVYVVIMSDGMWVSASFEDVLREIVFQVMRIPPSPTPEDLHATGAHLVDMFADGLDDCTAAVAYVFPK